MKFSQRFMGETIITFVALCLFKEIYGFAYMAIAYMAIRLTALKSD